MEFEFRENPDSVISRRKYRIGRNGRKKYSSENNPTDGPRDETAAKPRTRKNVPLMY